MGTATQTLWWNTMKFLICVTLQWMYWITFMTLPESHSSRSRWYLVKWRKLLYRKYCPLECVIDVYEYIYIYIISSLFALMVAWRQSCKSQSMIYTMNSPVTNTPWQWCHINAMASSITDNLTVSSTACSSRYQRKYQSPALLVLCEGD